MKYPQLVSMPSAVSDWLEEQLEARGIDAVVYTRYVISLLHPDPHDLSDPDFIGLEKLEVGDRRASSSQTRSKRFRKGHALPSDQLRRTAAVQCLMSAAEHNVGIESLVDELCLRLRQIDNQTDDQIDFADKDERVISDSNKKASPNDLARRYYAAFPALKGQSLTNADPTTTVVIPTKKVTWSNLTKKHTKSTNIQSFNRHSDKAIDKFSTSQKHYPKITKGQNSLNNIMRTKCSDRDRFPYFSRSKKSLAFNISSRIMDKSAERAEGRLSSTWDDQVNWYNHRNDDAALMAAMDEGYSTSDTITQLDDDQALGPIDAYSQKEMDDVEKLVAKFDRRIEAIWSPTHVTITEHIPDTLPLKEDDFQDLPVDFQELLASPTEQMIESADFYKPSESKRPVHFLQCGTNITNSIWSNRENNDEMSELGNSERYFYDQNETSQPYNFNAAKTFWTDENINVLEQQINANNLYESNFKREMKTEPSPKLKYNNFSWEFNFDANALTRQKWSDGTSEKVEQIVENEPVATTVITPEFISSLMKLNHHKSTSAFSEIIPKKPKNDDEAPVNVCSDVNTEIFTEVVESETNVSEEDDLLTSRKTHFCPIQLPDGFTFIVRGSPDHVNFRRTRSGTMFLESEADSPIEYMEFKRNCPTLGALENDATDQDIDENASSSNSNNFQLKFRVYKNEKYCQTEYVGQKMSESPNEIVPVKRRVLSSLSEYDMVSSSGDENGNDIIANIIDNNECICEKRGQNDRQDENEICWLFKCRAHPQEKGEWPRPENVTEVSNVWGEHIWSSHEQVNDGYFKNMAPAAPSSLRDELSQEGDQLLSHISSLQRLYLFELSTATPVTFHDDQRPLSSREERKRRHSTTLRSTTHTLRWRPAAHTPQALRSLTF